MPLLDIRARVVSAVKGHTGKRQVKYRNASRRSFDATVIAAGTSSGLKIKLNDVDGSAAIIDNVPACTAQQGAGSYSCYAYRGSDS